MLRQKTKKKKITGTETKKNLHEKLQATVCEQSEDPWIQSSGCPVLMEVGIMKQNCFDIWMKNDGG